MLFSILFLFNALLFGFIASFYIKCIDGLHKRIAFSIAAGVLFSAYLVFLVSLASQHLGLPQIIFSQLILLFSTFLMYKLDAKNIGEALEKERGFDKKEFLIIFAVFLVLAYFNNSTILLQNEGGDLTASGSVWADYPLHFSIISSFAYRDNFPPKYPILINAPMAYPFIVDFFSSILLVGGFSLRMSVIVPNILLSFSLISIAYFLVKALTKNKYAAFFAIILFFFNGNYGFIYALEDFAKNPASFFDNLRAYSHIPEKGIHFMNLVYAVFVPERSALLGFTISLLIYFILFSNLGKENKKDLFFAGALLGLLPLSHAHSFVAATIVSLALFAYSFLKGTRLVWVYFFAPFLLLALPQVYYILANQVGAGFFGIQVGWMEENSGKGLIDITVFWLKNIWLPLILAVIGFFLINKKTRILFIPFLLIFFISNVIKFQPQAWDNIKLLAHWFFITCAIAAVPLAKLFEEKNIFLKAVALAILGASIFSGVLTLIWWSDDHPVLYPKRDLIAAEWIRLNTPPEAVFLTDPKQHNHLVSTLAGRQVVMGYSGWLWTHGLQYEETERDVYAIYATGDCNLIKKYGVDYISLMPTDLSDAGKKVFMKLNKFILVYDAVFDGMRFKLFKTSC